MKVNREKSGIMCIHGGNIVVGQDVRGYPVKSSYKYLGLNLNGTLDLREHLSYINKRAGFVCSRLIGVRKL